MNEIWTPGQEPAQAAGQQPEIDLTEQTTSAIPGFDDLSNEDKEMMMDELRQIQEYLAASPAIDIIANHAVGMYELASLHLGLAQKATEDANEKAKRLSEAALAIQAMEGILNTMSAQLGQHKTSIEQGIASLKQVYGQLS